MNQPRYIAVIWSDSLEKIPNFKTPFESHVNKTDCHQKNRSSTTAIILYPFQMTPLFFLDAKNPSMFWIPNMFFSWISTYYTSIHMEKSLLSYIYLFLSKQIRFNNNKQLFHLFLQKNAMAKSSLGNLVLCLALLVALRCFSTTFVGPSTPTKTPWQQRRVALRSAEEDGQLFWGWRW